MMACKCLNENIELCKDALTERMSNSRYGAVEGSGDVTIVGKMWVISEGDHSPLTIKVLSEFRANKKDGTPMKNKTKLENYLSIKFCPFCGTEHTG